MFCPNCGKEDQADQKFCRSCGLKLDAISQVVADLLPSETYAALQKRKRIFEKLGLVSLSISGIIGLMLILFAVALYKLILFGPEAMFLASAIAMVVFLLLALILLSYPKLFMQFQAQDRQLDPVDESPSIQTTGKLLEEKFFEPVPSVTEDSTDLLQKRDAARRR